MRNLTTEEFNVLAHVVVDPEGWWTNCNSADCVDAEDALAGKVAKYKADYEAKSVLPGYKNRVERDAEE